MALLRRWTELFRRPALGELRARSCAIQASLEPSEKLRLFGDMKQAIRSGRTEAALEQLRRLDKQSKMLSAKRCTKLLRDCCDLGNAEVAKDILRFMADQGVATSKRSHSFFLGALSRAGDLDQAMEVLRTLSCEDLTSMFNSVLNGCASSGSHLHAQKCLELMAERDVPKNHQTYIELIKLAGKREDRISAKSLWEELKAKHTLVLNSYRTYIIALCRTMDLNEALFVLQQMLDELSTRIKPSEPIPALVTEVFNAIINAAAKGGQHKLAESLFTEMNRMELTVSTRTYNALIRAVVRGRGVDYGLKLVKSMEGSGLEPDRCTYSAILEGYCKQYQLDKAETLLQQMLTAKPSQRPSAHAFNFLLQACAAMNEQDRALRVFQTMKKELIAPDVCTYIALFSVFGSISIPFSGGDQDSHDQLMKRISAIESDMASTNVQHTAQTLTSLMQTLGSEGMLGALMKRLFTLETFSRQTGTCLLDACAYNTAMYAFIMNRQVGEAKDLFQRMISNGVKPDLQTYNVMLLGCARTKTLSYAYELLDGMKADGILPDSVTYNTLIKAACASGELETALDVIQTMDRVGVRADISTFNTVISAAAVHARVDMIEFLIGDMNERGIPPNGSTVLRVMLTYIQAKRLEDAVGAVKRLSLAMLGSQKDSARLQSLMQVLQDDNDEQVQDMTNTLGKLVLQPSAAETGHTQAMYAISLAGLLTGGARSDEQVT